MTEEKQKEGIKGVWIPGEVAFNKNLTKTDMFVWWQIDSLDSTKNNCYASNGYIAGRLSISTQTVSNSISKLKKYGYLIQISFDGKIRRLSRDDDYLKKYKHLVKEFNSLSQSLYADYNNSYSLPKPILIGDINKYNSNNDKKILSKDNIRQSLFIDKRIQNFQRKFKPPKLQVKKKLHVQKGTSQSRLISKWNNEFPGYNHSDMSTKTIKRAVHYIDSLLDHTFHEGKLWNKDWLKYTGITEKDIEKFVKSISSMTDIFIVFNAGLKDMYLEGFAPVSKKGLPKALADVFFTPYTENNGGGKSKFVEAALRPPKPVKSKTERDPYPGITEDLVELGIIDSSQMKNEQWKKYYSGVKSIAEYLSEIDWNNQGALQLFLGGEEGNPYNLVMEYVKWMKGENPDLLSPKTIPDKWHFNMITPSFWMWNQFMYSVNRYWGRVFQNLSEGE